MDKNQQKEPQKIYGVVCIVDALGVKNYSDQEIAVFLESRGVIHNALKGKCEEQVDWAGIEPPKLAFFNDTIVIAIEIKTPNAEKGSMLAMGYIVRKLISDGISKRIFFRGAIGVGTFFVDLDNDTVIGEAVADAANWSEELEMIGCILTPRAAIVLEKNIVNTEWKPIWVFFVHDTPLKSGIKNNVCINWPRAFFNEYTKPIDCKSGSELKYLYTKLSESFIPKTVENKYYNTIDFFKVASKQIKKKK